MEVVTLAQVRLERPGSASGPGMGRHSAIEVTREVADGRPETLKALVIELAGPHGDSATALGNLRQERADYYSPVAGAVVFNVDGPATQYSTAYAICLAFSALKSGTRYFKLDEILGVGR
jgi:hypothetical protein